jgi:hypothetical protein
MAGETWIGDLLGIKDIKYNGGASFPRRSVLDFLGNVTVEDDPVAKKTKVTILSGGGGSASPVEYKAPCRAASTANLALSGLVTIDGVALNDGDRVLAKDQSTASQNGLYIARSTAWERAPDADTSAEVTAGMIVAVEEGTTQHDSVWMLQTNDPIVLATSGLSFKRIDSGDALSLAGKLLDSSVGSPTDKYVLVYDNASGKYKAALLSNANLATGAAVAVSKLAAGSNGQVIRVSGGVPTWADLSSSDYGENPITPPTIATHQSNYSPTGFSDATFVRLQSNNNNWELRGLDGTATVKRKTLLNFGANVIPIKHDAAGQTAGNKIYTPTGTDYVLGPNESVVVVKDAVTDVWWVVGRDLEDKNYAWTGNHSWTGTLTCGGIYAPGAFSNIQCDGYVSAGGNVSAGGSLHADDYVYGQRFYATPAAGMNRVWTAAQGHALSGTWQWVTEKIELVGSGGIWAWAMNGNVPPDITITDIWLYYSMSTGSGTFNLMSNNKHCSALTVHETENLTYGTDTFVRLTPPFTTPLAAFTPYTNTYKLQVQIPGGSDISLHSVEVAYDIGVVWPS